MLHRRGFVGAVMGAAAGLWAWPTHAARNWRYTTSKPPNGRQFIHARVSREFDIERHQDLNTHALIVRANFNGDTFETQDAKLHRLLDDILAEARAELAKHPEIDVWRLGELRLRWRGGHIQTATDQWFFDGGLGKDEQVKGAV